MKHIAFNCIDVSEFSEGLAAIFTAEGVGFINTNGELVIPTVFEDVDWNTMLNTRYMFKEGLSAEVEAEGEVIERQMPPAGETVNKGTKILLHLR